MSWESFNKNVSKAIKQIEDDWSKGVSRCPVCEQTYKTLMEMRNCSDSHVSYGAKELGKRGGETRAKKYSKEQIKQWGRKGGRPKKITE